MRRYADSIDVSRGLVAGQEAPSQFLWRGKLWVVRDVVSHWVETGAWWDQPGVAALFGATTAADDNGGRSVARSDEHISAGAAELTGGGADLLGEREVWRVEAIRGQEASGVFDLSFDWASGSWFLVRVAD